MSAQTPTGFPFKMLMFSQMQLLRLATWPQLLTRPPSTWLGSSFPTLLLAGWPSSVTSLSTERAAPSRSSPPTSLKPLYPSASLCGSSLPTVVSAAKSALMTPTPGSALLTILPPLVLLTTSGLTAPTQLAPVSPSSWASP